MITVGEGPTARDKNMVLVAKTAGNVRQSPQKKNLICMLAC